MEFRFTRHAGEEAKRRGIAMDTITEVMNHPLAIVDINTAPISIVTV